MNIIIKREYRFTEEEIKEFIISFIQFNCITFMPKDKVEKDYADTISGVMAHLRNGNHLLGIED